MLGYVCIQGGQHVGYMDCIGQLCILQGSVTTFTIQPSLCLNVPQLRKYAHDSSHLIELDDVQIKKNLTFKTLHI
jgi:hypothetical protein